MRLSGSPQPVISFATPQVLEPEEVVEARLRFADVVEKYSDTNDELGAARQALVVAQADDIKEAAAAFAAGKEPKDTTKREREAQTRIDELEGRKRALTRAVDVAGNSFAQAIGEARDEWLPPLQEAEAEAAARYAAAIAAAQSAATDLRVVRAAVPWVEGFDRDEAVGGRYSPFHGGRLRVRAGRSSEQEVADLLALAARVVRPLEVIHA